MIIRCCIFILLLCAAATVAYSQSERSDSLPKSFTYSSLSKPLSQEFQVQTITTDVPNVDSVETLERVLDSLGAIRPYRFGIEIPVNISNRANGTLDELEDGSFIWRLRVICPGAKSINFIYKSTSLPQGSFLYTYNAERTSLEGPWHNRNTRAGKKLGTFPVQGNTVIIEVYIPRDKGSEVVLNLGKVIYGFQETSTLVSPSLSKYNSAKIQSLSCNVNVDCPDGSDWCREKYSVSRVLVEEGSAWCTGSLLNNTQENFTPYLLTAFHCLDNNLDYYSPTSDGTLSTGEIAQVEDWSFQFGYIHQCYISVVYGAYSYSGAVFRSGWNTTDFALLELNQQPASGDFVDVYFNGWDRTGDTPENTTCIHHPQGDYMKISKDYQSPSICSLVTQCNSADPGGTSFWRARWDIGTVQHGSSGSPLLDQNRKVIGQLWGGCDCNSTLNNAFFGRLSLSWTGGGTNNTRLGNWLDPVHFDPGNLSASPNTMNGIKLDNLQYGETYLSGAGSHDFNAYDRIRFGSHTYGSGVLWCIVDNGAIMNVKAEREIDIRSCTWIKSGAEARFYIGTVTCSDVIHESDEEDHYQSCTSGSAYQEPREKRSTQDIPSSDVTPNHDIRIIPNPATDEIQILGTITASVELFSSVGLSVMTIEKGVRKVDVSQLTSGVYYARIPTVTGVVVKSFMIIR